MIDPNNPDYANTPASAQRPVYGYRPADPTAPPAATIVTPFYNTGAIFYETARSILRQSFQQWEWLIINDASTQPEALAILDEYRYMNDPRIRVIDMPTNQGPGAARNLAFREARAPYVVQLDSDNLLEPTAIEKWLWFLESYPECSFVKGYSVGFGAHQYLWRQGFYNGTEFLEENLVDATSAQRTAVHHTVGCYDETIRHGFEDWDFWLRCASLGYWGGTIPEYLDWYRRRETHSDRWADWDDAERQRIFREGLRQKYPALWNDGFPQIEPRFPQPYDTLPNSLPWENRLSKDKPRLVMIVPWMAMGAADAFNLDLLEQLSQRGWEVSIATTLSSDHPWLPVFAHSTPDVFILQNFLRRVDYPRFLRSLICSRQADVVLVSQSELGYQLLPYLRAYCPQAAFIDYCHMEEEYCGSYPRLAVEYQELLDINAVSSSHLKDWMVQRGAEADRIRICYTNIDPVDQMADQMEAVMTEAKHLLQSQPRPQPRPGLGLACASQAIGYGRLSQLVDGFWQEREKRRSIHSDESQVRKSHTASSIPASTWQLATYQHSLPPLEKSKPWLEDQWQRWQHITSEQEHRLQDQHKDQLKYLRELEAGKQWLEDQWQRWQQIASEQEHPSPRPRQIPSRTRGRQTMVRRPVAVLACSC